MAVAVYTEISLDIGVKERICYYFIVFLLWHKLIRRMYRLYNRDISAHKNISFFLISEPNKVRCAFFHNFNILRSYYIIRIKSLEMHAHDQQSFVVIINKSRINKSNSFMNARINAAWSFVDRMLRIDRRANFVAKKSMFSFSKIPIPSW